MSIQLSNHVEILLASHHPCWNLGHKFYWKVEEISVYENGRGYADRGKGPFSQEGEITSPQHYIQNSVTIEKNYSHTPRYWCRFLYILVWVSFFFIDGFCFACLFIYISVEMLKRHKPRFNQQTHRFEGKHEWRQFPIDGKFWITTTAKSFLHKTQLILWSCCFHSCVFVCALYTTATSTEHLNIFFHL